MFITRKHLSRRTTLRSIGAPVTLPLLDSMVPAQTPLRRTAAAARTRFATIEMVHGAAGSTMMYLDLMKLVLAKGGDPNARLLKTLWFRPTSHNQEWVDRKGATPFWRAAQSSDVAPMRLLIERGADPKIATEEGVTPLMVAAGLGWGANATRNVPDAWLAAVRYCMELGLDVNAKDIYSYTALHGAAYRGDNEVVKFLVERGAKLDVRSRKGQTVTDMANGPMVNAHLPIEHPDTIALLIKLGAPGPEVPVAGAPRQGRGAITPSPSK